MKKVFASLLALIYFTTSTGAAVNMHYCMGKLYAVDLMNTVQCHNCGMEKASGEGCCKDEVMIVKVKDIHQQTTADITINSPSALVSSNQFFFNLPYHTVAGNIQVNTHPPPFQFYSLCIYNCVFRI